MPKSSNNLGPSRVAYDPTYTTMTYTEAAPALAPTIVPATVSLIDQNWDSAGTDELKKM